MGCSCIGLFISCSSCMLLLQSWAWYQITSITPTVDSLSDEDIEVGPGFLLATRLFFMPFTKYYKFDLYLFLKKLIILYHRWSLPAQRTSMPTYALHLLRNTFDHLEPKEAILNFYYTIYFSCHAHANNIFFQFLWTPYRAHHISRLITIDVSDVSRIVVPLIYFSKLSSIK